MLKALKSAYERNVISDIVRTAPETWGKKDGKKNKEKEKAKYTNTIRYWNIFKNLLNLLSLSIFLIVFKFECNR